MKTKTFLALFCLLCISSGFSSCQRHSSDQWKLVWEDNFDQKTGFDPQVWSKIPRGKSDWNNYMTDFDSCFDMRDGNMVLRGIINHSQPNDTAPYLTGGIYTKGKKAFSNGRLEIRAKLNGARGEWPAIWMLPIDAPWPMGGEIDIMEHVKQESAIHHTIHTHYTYDLNIKDPSNTAQVTCNYQDWNIYALEWSEDKLTFFINGQETFSYSNLKLENEAEMKQWPFTKDSSFYLILNMGLGGDRPGSWAGPIDDANLPAIMEIDWVKITKLDK